LATLLSNLPLIELVEEINGVRTLIRKSRCSLRTLVRKGLEFIEMEEFLPTNKTVMILENSSSIQQGVLGALQQLQQVGSCRRVGDIITWLQCYYSLYVAVMSKQNLAPMINHMHSIHAIKGGMLWLQYDWKA